MSCDSDKDLKRKTNVNDHELFGLPPKFPKFQSNQTEYLPKKVIRSAFCKKSIVIADPEISSPNPIRNSSENSFLKRCIENPSIDKNEEFDVNKSIRNTHKIGLYDAETLKNQLKESFISSSYNDISTNLEVNKNTNDVSTFRNKTPQVRMESYPKNNNMVPVQSTSSFTNIVQMRESSEQQKHIIINPTENGGHSIILNGNHSVTLNDSIVIKPMDKHEPSKPFKLLPQQNIQMALKNKIDIDNHKQQLILKKQQQLLQQQKQQLEKQKLEQQRKEQELLQKKELLRTQQLQWIDQIQKQQLQQVRIEKQQLRKERIEQQQKQQQQKQQQQNSNMIVIKSNDQQMLQNQSNLIFINGNEKQLLPQQQQQRIQQNSNNMIVLNSNDQQIFQNQSNVIIINGNEKQIIGAQSNKMILIKPNDDILKTLTRNIQIINPNNIIKKLTNNIQIINSVNDNNNTNIVKPKSNNNANIQIINPENEMIKTFNNNTNIVKPKSTNNANIQIKSKSNLQNISKEEFIKLNYRPIQPLKIREITDNEGSIVISDEDDSDKEPFEEEPPKKSSSNKKSTTEEQMRRKAFNIISKPKSNDNLIINEDLEMKEFNYEDGGDDDNDDKEDNKIGINSDNDDEIKEFNDDDDNNDKDNKIGDEIKEINDDDDDNNDKEDNKIEISSDNDDEMKEFNYDDKEDNKINKIEQIKLLNIENKQMEINDEIFSEDDVVFVDQTNIFNVDIDNENYMKKTPKKVMKTQEQMLSNSNTIKTFMPCETSTPINNNKFNINDNTKPNKLLITDSTSSTSSKKMETHQNQFLTGTKPTFEISDPVNMGNDIQFFSSPKKKHVGLMVPEDDKHEYMFLVTDEKGNVTVQNAPKPRTIIKQTLAERIQKRSENLLKSKLEEELYSRPENLLKAQLGFKHIVKKPELILNPVISEQDKQGPSNPIKARIAQELQRRPKIPPYTIVAEENQRRPIIKLSSSLVKKKDEETEKEKLAKEKKIKEEKEKAIIAEFDKILEATIHGGMKMQTFEKKIKTVADETLRKKLIKKLEDQLKNVEDNTPTFSSDPDFVLMITEFDQSEKYGSLDFKKITDENGIVIAQSVPKKKSPYDVTPNIIFNYDYRSHNLFTKQPSDLEMMKPPEITANLLCQFDYGIVIYNLAIIAKYLFFCGTGGLLGYYCEGQVQVLNTSIDEDFKCMATVLGRQHLYAYGNTNAVVYSSKKRSSSVFQNYHFEERIVKGFSVGHDTYLNMDNKRVFEQKTVKDIELFYQPTEETPIRIVHFVKSSKLVIQHCTQEKSNETVVETLFYGASQKEKRMKLPPIHHFIYNIIVTDKNRLYYLDYKKNSFAYCGKFEDADHIEGWRDRIYVARGRNLEIYRITYKKKISPLIKSIEFQDVISKILPKDENQMYLVTGKNEIWLVSLDFD